MSKEAVIVPKLTLVEWEMQSRKVARTELIEQWQKEGVDVDRALSSHDRQKETIDRLAEALQVEQIHRDNWNHEQAEKYKFVIAPGGDNHMQYVARFILKDQILLGLNSDPQTSKGATLVFTPEDINYIKEKLNDGKFKIESWTRLQAILNGKLLPFYALSEIFIGEVKSRGMNRNILTYKGIVEEQKNSGFIIATGVGMSDGAWGSNIISKWKESITRDFPKFSKLDLRARLVSRERMDGVSSIDIADIELGEKIEFQSLNKNGEVSFDPDPSDDQFSFPFKRGCKVTIEIAKDHPLNVAVKEA